jgi:hypothetical protein
LVAGEDAGQGIQKGVGVSGLERFYVVFGVRVNRLWMPSGVWKGVRVEEGRVFNIFDFQTFQATIDFRPRWRMDGQGVAREVVDDEEGGWTEKLEKLAVSQHDAGGDVKEAEVEDGNPFTANSEVERMT